jgi:hypothetical protein
MQLWKMAAIQRQQIAVRSPAMVLIIGTRRIFAMFHARSIMPGITGSQKRFLPAILLLRTRIMSIAMRQNIIHPCIIKKRNP